MFLKRIYISDFCECEKTFSVTENGLNSFLTSPHPISSIDGCRIGGSGGFIGNCPGPCPNYNIAADANPLNPTAIFHRGSYHRVVWTRNNHEGGFSRWTLVPVNKMNSKHWHSKMAFHYSCWNVGRFNCNAFDFHRDCNYDRDNEAFSKMLYIPPIYPDGYYVLGFTWFGGGIGSGHFGDYYDCAYVKIQGGLPLQDSFVPGFTAGGGSQYEDGCEATVDRLGICWKEPCKPLRKTSKLVPVQFKNDQKPPPVLSEWFKYGHQEVPHSVYFEELKLVDALKNRILDVDLRKVIPLNRNDEISIMVETSGHVEYVEWYTNGKMNGRDFDAPFSIAGDADGTFFPWMHPLFNRRVRIAFKIVGKDKSFCWGNLELRFQETTGEGTNRLTGVMWDDFKPRKRSSTDQDEPNSRDEIFKPQDKLSLELQDTNALNNNHEDDDALLEIETFRSEAVGSRRRSSYSFIGNLRSLKAVEEDKHLKRSTSYFS